MDKFIKRLQTRASRKGLSVTKSQVREVYQSVVTTPESPSEEEMSAVIQRLETQYQAPSHEPNTSELTTTEQSTLTQQEEVKEMPQANIETTPAQPAQEPSPSTLAKSPRSGLSQASSGSMGITSEQIQQAVEQQFGRENVETKQAILNYIAQDTFATATELQTALGKLRQMRRDILMKLIADHNQASASDESLLKTALLQASASRQQETADFFVSFDAQLLEMRSAFGI